MFATDFETEERNFKNRKTTIAGTVTIVLHTLILLFLIWTILTPPNPPYTESAGGVAVNFGTDEIGSGEEQPMTLTPIQAEQTSPPSSSNPKEASQEEIATQDLEEAPTVEKPKTETKKTKPEMSKTKPVPNKNTPTNSKNTELPAPPAPKADPNALFSKGASGNPNKSKGDGTGNIAGDQGKPYGDPNSKSYMEGEGGNGNGTGKGIGSKGGVSLNGRRSASLPAPKFCNATGNVIIDITVDRTGNVIDAKYHRNGSTITDNCSIQNAISAAKRSKFNADADADEWQYGSINYVFTVQ